jgi:hypothetical protein
MDTLILIFLRLMLKKTCPPGNQARPKLFDLAIVKPDMLYEEVVEVRGRIIPKRQDCTLVNDWPVVKGTKVGVLRASHKIFNSEVRIC